MLVGFVPSGTEVDAATVRPLVVVAVIVQVPSVVAVAVTVCAAPTVKVIGIVGNVPPEVTVKLRLIEKPPAKPLTVPVAAQEKIPLCVHVPVPLTVPLIVNVPEVVLDDGEAPSDMLVDAAFVKPAAVLETTNVEAVSAEVVSV